MTIQSQLDQVLALSDIAQSGPWTTITGDLVCDAFGHGVAACVGGMEADNAAFIAAACNFLRQHGPAIRDAVGGEAVAWMLRRKRDDFVRGCYATKPTAESMEFAELDGDYYTPLYASPPATVDVGALQRLEMKWRYSAALLGGDREEEREGQLLQACADELAALIGEKA